MGPCRPRGRQGLRALDEAGRQTGARPLAAPDQGPLGPVPTGPSRRPGTRNTESGDRKAHPRSEVRRHDSGPLRDGAADVLRLPPGAQHRVAPVNPFPLARGRRTARANAHHNPEKEHRKQRAGLYRPKIPKRIPRRIPDDKYAEVFAGLRSHRDRALLAFWLSTGARAEELLTSRQVDAVVGRQTIGVIRKGTHVYQELPATGDAFVWLRLYQEQSWRDGVPRGRTQPLWWTLRRPWRPLAYDAARMMFNRANELLGSNWTLHDLRHTATFRMLDDPTMSPVYVQHILGHRYLSTLDIYNNPSHDDVIVAGLAHHERQRRKRESPPPAASPTAYNQDSLNNLFGGPIP
ncbi:site-specific integrase [Embleya sp. NPDC005971]|uniref:tyrosine-type recombinase/integrase n=1 Tax=Embleya sp. NPDC005971 TaxID=3156724 RepID=UPI00340685CA